MNIPKLKMHYRSVADLNADVVAWLPSLPRDLDVVVGIPRSGLLVANLIAMHLNLPLADLDGFLANRRIGTGKRFRQTKVEDAERVSKALIVDDTFHTGQAMEDVRYRLHDLSVPHELFFAAVYVTPGTGSRLDFYAKEVPQPRAFEWNVMHHENLVTNCCMDIDGVLCRDPTDAENDDGEAYVQFIKEVESRHLPTHKVPYLVTSRLEKYRTQTEEWLARVKVPYGELVMLDLPTALERRRQKCHASFKAEVYGRTETVIFYESSVGQAKEIANRSGKFVFCTDSWQMVQPHTASRSTWILKRAAGRIMRTLNLAPRRH